MYAGKKAAKIVSPKYAAWLQPMPRHGFSNRRVDDIAIVSNAEYTGWAACHLTASSPGMFQPQPIAKHFNRGLVIDWISACKEFHCQSCCASVSVPGLLLIDCESLQLSCVSHQPPYIALSYVWEKKAPGNVKMPTYLTIDGRPRLPPEDSLPQVVMDSISVTKQLGFRYLWVDKYCIDQCDDAIKKNQIENMDLVYMGAELTIIAAAGKDERHGLPGVVVERISCRAVEVGSVTITAVPSEPWVTFEGSNWAQRAWTFQEELLSRHRLYFSEHQVFFICHEMLCSEARGGAEFAKDAQSMKTYSTASRDSASLNKLVTITQNMEFINGVSSSKGFQSRKERLNGLWGLVNRYTARNLTYDSDALKGFAGICRVFEEGQCPIYNVQGLPVIPFVKSGLGRSEINLVSTLCWEHDPSLTNFRRRTQFSSWTWAGWTGSIRSPYGLESPAVFEVGSSGAQSQPILVEYEDGYRATLEELTESLEALRLERMKKRRGHQLLQSDHPVRSTETPARDLSCPVIIHLRAPILPVQLFSFSDPTDWKTGSFAGMRLMVYLDTPRKDNRSFTPLEFMNGMAAETLGCILLRADSLGDIIRTTRADRAHLLLLQWHGVTEAHRIGKLTAETTQRRSFSPAKLIEKLEWRDLGLL